MQDAIRILLLWVVVVGWARPCICADRSLHPGVSPAGKSTARVGVKSGLAVDGSRTDVIKSIEFEGNRKFKDNILRQRLGFEVGGYLDAFLAEGGRLTIAEVYRKIGFTFVEVGLDRQKLAQGHLFYRITEGPRVRVKSVKFVGNRAISSGTLRKVAKTKKRKRLYWPHYYTEESVAEDLERLREFYYERGFLDYKMSARKEFTADNGQVSITFEIDEGPAYRVGKIVFTGNEYFAEDKLRESIELREGELYLKPKAEKDAGVLNKLYREHGYVDAEVRQAPRFTPESGANVVNVEYAISEGRRFRIGRIDVTGNEISQDKVVRRVLDEYGFTPSSWYNADIAPKEGGGLLEKYVQRRALAEEVMIRPVDPGDRSSDRKDVHVDVKEGMTGMIMPGVAITSDSGVIGRLIFQQMNFDITDWPEDLGELVTMKAFRGAGQSLKLSLEPGTELSQYSARFSDPYFRDRPVTFDLTGASWLRYRESYDEGRLRGVVRFEQRRPDRWRPSVRFRAENVSVRRLDFDAPREITEVKGDSAVLGAQLGLGRRMVDDLYNPSKGFEFDVNYEQVTGDFDFGTAGGKYVHYLLLHEDVLGRKTVLAAKVEAASIVGDAPPFEKFYAGGTSRYGIRGFEYRGVSTRGLQQGVANPIRRDPIGSDWIFLANTEAVVPLVGENFGALFFVDSGTIDTGSYRLSIGTGIQIIVPQFLGPVPMRFEIATPLLKDELDERQIFSFSFGGLGWLF